MSPERLHEDEATIDDNTVRRLVDGQFPRWASLPLRELTRGGTDNVHYRLGDDLLVRLPRTAHSARLVAKEQTWLPRLAECLPCAVPEPVAIGTASDALPWPWSVYLWLDGESLPAARVDERAFALDLAAVVQSLRALDLDGHTRAGLFESYRGGLLDERDDDTRMALADLGRKVEVDRLTAVWAACLRTEPPDHPHVWTHSDLQPGNVLVRDGRLHAVIDWGGLSIGDPTIDLIAAWFLLTPTSRPVFRAALDVDDATWARARGWSLSLGLLGLWYYEHRSPAFAAQSRAVLEQVLADD